MLLILGIVSFGCVCADGAPVSSVDAELVAQAFLRYDAGKSFAYRTAVGVPEGARIEGSTELRDPESGDLLGYVFAIDPSGYVVVTAETQLVPVIAYSYAGECSWGESEENILLSMLRLDLRWRLMALSEKSVPKATSDSNEMLWQAYLGADGATGAGESTRIYGPLLTTEWDQRAPYNDHCPVDSEHGGTSVVGCVATALAQILNYWQYPTEVTLGSYVTQTHSWSIDGPAASFSDLNYAAGELSDEDKARLSYAAGVSVRMDYCSLGSGASVANVAAALAGNGPEPGVSECWGYESADVRAYSADYSDWGSPYYVTEEEFFSQLSNDMIAAQPAEMGIHRHKPTSGAVVRHAIVVDGWQSGGRVYHLNWGGGSCSGWYSLPEGMPREYTVIDYAVLDVRPPAEPTSSLFPHVGDLRLPEGTTVIREGTVTGIEEGDLYIPAGATLYLEQNSTFVWNPGYSIHNEGGQITHQAGSSLRKGYLCVQYRADACWSNMAYCDGAACPAGSMRWKDVPAGVNQCSAGGAEVSAFLLCGENRGDFKANVANMESTLRTWWNVCSVTVWNSWEHTKAELSTALESWMSRADLNDLVIFYYAGHGLPGMACPTFSTGEGIILYDPELDDWLENAAETTLVVLDSCYSGSALEGSFSLGKPGRWVVTSTNPEEEATCWANCAWSPLWNVGCIFTTYFTEALRWHEPEIAGADELISLREAFNYAREKCAGYLFGHLLNQHPQIWPADGDLVVESQGTNPDGTHTLRVAGFCPIDTVITDPQGRVLSADTNEIGQDAFRVTGDFDEDGQRDFVYVIGDSLPGEYRINVIPDVGALPNDTYRLYAAVDEVGATLADSVQVADIPDAPYEVVVGCLVQQNALAASGWHMVSLPGQLCEPCTWVSGECGDLVCALGDDIDPFYAFRYDADLRSYARVPPADQVCYQSGMGMWIYTWDSDTQIDSEVTALTGNVELALQNGWNQIGNPYTFSIGTGSIRVRCGAEELSLIEAQAQGWITALLYGYEAGAYVEIDPASGCLPAWTGCWLRAYRADCTLVFQPVGCTSSLTQARPLSTAEARALDLPPPPPLNPQAFDIKEVLAGLSATNIPNPIRSEHTTVFSVEGVRADMVDEMRVDIYDQSGQRVFTQAIVAKEVAWHTVNDAGELLANGVYLYQVWVKIGEIWYPLEIQKLAVVR